MLWGGNSVAIKLAAVAFPPCRMAAYRFALGCLLTGVFARATGIDLRLTRDQVWMVLVNGLLTFLQIGLFTVGTTMSTSVHSVILVNVYPFFTTLSIYFLLPDLPLTRAKLVGLAVAFVGVVVMFGDHLGIPDERQFAGDLLLVVSAAILGFKFTFVKTLLGRISAFRLVFWEGIAAVPLFLAASWWFEGPAGGGLTVAAVLAVFYQGWAVSSIAFVVWMLLLTRHAPDDLAAFSFTTPLFGTLFGCLALGDPLTPFLLAGGALIVLGIRLINARVARANVGDPSLAEVHALSKSGSVGRAPVEPIPPAADP